VAGDIAVGIRSLRLEQELVQSLINLQVVMLQTVEAIASIAEMRDPYTAGHQRGVTQLACALGKELDLDDDRLEGLRVSGFLHDIGKIAVPAEILNKPGKLNDFELQIIRTHSQVGCDILKKINFPWPVAQIVLQHHERINGSGYPQGITGPDILLEARILAVADVVEAMAAHRPYRPSLGLEKALDEIVKNKGILYDPEVADACIRLFREKGYTFS
jgi:putative nucleotidyltransferase with HDIG domain